MQDMGAGEFANFYLAVYTLHETLNEFIVNCRLFEISHISVIIILIITSIFLCYNITEII